ncbi:GNAT family N-acetyltransferase [Trinickia diaoshuihuensis]|uniref:GNAT family N-acetyltransferase n=1 Tax=Trinickia diaoshuihuensis TaxID=2292265 RepID=UPI001F082F3C|nr:GNAT family N-acetyltransferase [Trinickia diaoshuihuensis]
MSENDTLTETNLSIAYAGMEGIPALVASGADEAVAVHRAGAMGGNGAADTLVLHARWMPGRGLVDLTWASTAHGELRHAALLAAFGVAFAADRSCRAISVDTAHIGRRALDSLRRCGVLTMGGKCLRETWAQQPDLWLTGAARLPPAALSYEMTGMIRHPRRPPYRDGIVYTRELPRFGHRFTLRTASIESDLPVLHQWLNEPRVNAFWGEAGGLHAHRAYLERQLAAPHVHPLIGAFDDEPFGYFEAYWAKEDRISPFAEPGEHDRGVHMLVGQTRWRGAHCVAAWLPSLLHYLFLDDPRTQAVVCEPRHDNVRMIAYLREHGFAALRPFDFPHKRALLMRTIRESFFDARPI